MRSESGENKPFEYITTSRGQDDGREYEIPPIRIYICADSAKNDDLIYATHSTFGNFHVSNLLELLKKVYDDDSTCKLSPSDNVHTSPEFMSFVWVVDYNFNIIFAPSLQRRVRHLRNDEIKANGCFEVKHGDLVPGYTKQTRVDEMKSPITAFNRMEIGGHSTFITDEMFRTGNFRGPARLGGELNYYGEGEPFWEINGKSGYTLARIDVATLSEKPQIGLDGLMKFKDILEKLDILKGVDVRLKSYAFEDNPNPVATLLHFAVELVAIEDATVLKSKWDEFKSFISTVKKYRRLHKVNDLHCTDPDFHTLRGIASGCKKQIHAASLREIPAIHLKCSDKLRNSCLWTGMIVPKDKSVEAASVED
eukprot:g3155.t1